MKTFYTQVKKIVDNSLKNRIFKKKKKDNSMLTINDLKIQKEIINLIKKKFPEVKQFICEENFNINNYHNIDFKKPFAIIDPIDGTENFYAGNKMFGTLISMNLAYSKKVDLIYLPKKNLMITRENVKKIKLRAKKNNNLVLLSTKCLMHKYKGSQYRIFGSCAFSFYQFITGQANQFMYCDGAKVWDCFTGLRLANIINCKVITNNKRYMVQPKFKTKFILKWA
jgi:fructose-1,6-bisphosphatase/inositol monophosphatase family enzyme